MLIRVSCYIVYGVMHIPCVLHSFGRMSVYHVHITLMSHDPASYLLNTDDEKNNLRDLWEKQIFCVSTYNKQCLTSLGVRSKGPPSNL